MSSSSVPWATAVVEPNASIKAAAIAPNTKLLNLIIVLLVDFAGHTGGEQPDDAGIDYAQFFGPQSSKWPSPRTYASSTLGCNPFGLVFLCSHVRLLRLGNCVVTNRL